MDDRELLRECIKTRGELGERMLAAEARVRTLEEALREWDTLSLVIESAVRAEVCRDARAVEHYNRLVRLIHSARAALRGGE
jgi:hypothetical protein